MLQAALQVSDQAARVLLDKDLSSHLSVNEQRAVWRATITKAIAPDVASSADVDSVPVLAVFDGLSFQKHSVNLQVKDDTASSCALNKVKACIKGASQKNMLRETARLDPLGHPESGPVMQLHKQVMIKSKIFG